MKHNKWDTICEEIYFFIIRKAYSHAYTGELFLESIKTVTTKILNDEEIKKTIYYVDILLYISWNTYVVYKP